MSDVRLTATNPEDSSVVPVACNAKGELLLEETPPGFDGNVDGDLTVSGGASFANGYTNGGVSIASSGGIACGSYLQAGGDVGPRAILNSGDVLLGYNNGVMTSSILKEGTLRLGGALDSGGYNIELNSNGSASFDGYVVIGGNYAVNESYVAVRGPGQIEIGRNATDVKVFISGTWYYNGTINETFQVRTDGSATFTGDVVVGSRSKQWMLIEQGGLCHMVEQTTAATADLIDSDSNKYPPLRDVFSELNAIEKALGEVMEKLRMTPPAGWEVWDGSSENS